MSNQERGTVWLGDHSAFANFIDAPISDEQVFYAHQNLAGGSRDRRVHLFYFCVNFINLLG